MGTFYFYLSNFFGCYFYFYLSNFLASYMYFYLSSETRYLLKHCSGQGLIKVRNVIAHAQQLNRTLMLLFSFTVIL